MRNTSELAESHRHLTVKVEAKSSTANAVIHASKDAIIPEKKSHLPLPNPL